MQSTIFEQYDFVCRGTRLFSEGNQLLEQNFHKIQQTSWFLFTAALISVRKMPDWTSEYVSNSSINIIGNLEAIDASLSGIFVSM